MKKRFKKSNGTKNYQLFANILIKTIEFEFVIFELLKKRSVLNKKYEMLHTLISISSIFTTFLFILFDKNKEEMNNKYKTKK